MARALLFALHSRTGTGDSPGNENTGGRWRIQTRTCEKHATRLRKAHLEDSPLGHRAKALQKCTSRRPERFQTRARGVRGRPGVVGSRANSPGHHTAGRVRARCRCSTACASGHVVKIHCGGSLIVLRHEKNRFSEPRTIIYRN